MVKRFKSLAVLVCMLLTYGCASLTPGFQSPEVSLVSFAPVPSNGLLEQRFKVGLRVLNPNGVALPVNGLSYSLKLNGHKVVSGVASEIPELPAYGDVKLDLEAGVSLLGGARFISSLLQGGGEALDYELETRLDVGVLLPAIVLSEKGRISLGE